MVRPQSARWQRLRNAMDYSRRRLQPFRDHRVAFVRQYVGYRYSDDGTKNKVPVNLMEMAVSVYCRALAANKPRVIVSSHKPQYKPMAYEIELALNQLLEEIQFGETMQHAVRDAMFSMGIVKVGLAYGGKMHVAGSTLDVGQPFADTVDLDDWVHDMSARKWGECSYMGNRYRLPTEFLKQSDMFTFKNGTERMLGAPLNSDYNEFGGEKVEVLSRGQEGAYDEYLQYNELWDVYVPQDQLVVTFISDDQGSPFGEPIRVVEWEGPEEGPFHILSFSEVPNNIMPVSPASLWYDLHDLYNRLYNKLGRQAERQKTLLGVQSAAGDDGERVINAQDGEAVRLDNPANAKEYAFGGPVQENLAFAIHTKDLFSWQSGNLDSIAGLGPSTDTVGQDRLIAMESSKRTAHMEDRTAHFTSGIVKALGLFLWEDPLIELPLTKRPKGSDISIPSRWTPDQREGTFWDYNIGIEPYSMQHKSPSVRVQTISQVMSSFVLPLMPQLEQQGIVVNWEGLLRTIAKYTDMHEIEDLLMFGNDSAMSRMVNASGPGSATPGGAANTTRTYERVNRPGATNQGKDYAMMMNLFGGSGPGVQQSELNAIGRPTS